MKHLYLNIIKWFLPFLFIFYMAGITLFTHSHVVNGVTIVHSHPFKKDTPHGHTTVEFQLLHFLNHVVSTDAGVFLFSLAFVATLLCTLLWCSQAVCHYTSYRGVLCLRGPPAYRF